jgi:hypothetical protein
MPESRVAPTTIPRCRGKTVLTALTVPRACGSNERFGDVGEPFRAHPRAKPASLIDYQMPADSRCWQQSSARAPRAAAPALGRHWDQPLLAGYREQWIGAAGSRLANSHTTTKTKSSHNDFAFEMIEYFGFVLPNAPQLLVVSPYCYNHPSFCASSNARIANLRRDNARRS